MSGSSSVDLSNAPAPRPRKPDLEAEAEQLTISPDEFDDIWQTGVRARAALGLKLDAQEAELKSTEPQGETDPIEMPTAADTETHDDVPDAKRPTQQISSEDWKVVSRETAESDAPPLDMHEDTAPFGMSGNVVTDELAGPTQPSRRAPAEVIQRGGLFGGFRRVLAGLFRAIAGWLDPQR
ncbi:MAG: hypothetical protein AAFY60_06075 [Myxococcota bacterium]